jgi:Ca2+-binding RTX toxin-like protein
MKKNCLVLVVLALAGLGFASSADAAANRAVAGVASVKGKPTLVLSGTNRLENFQVTRYAATPPEEDPISGKEVLVYAISENVHGLGLASDSLSGRCWAMLGDVYCRVNGIKSVIAKLGGGHDSFLAEKGLQVTVDGGSGDDMIFGGKKNDRLTGGPGRDSVTGEGGNDVISGGAGNDTLNGDTWRDPVFFRPYKKPAGRDRINGGPGADDIQGGAGVDILLGGPGGDSFYNNRDRDRDRMVGGPGRDTVHDPDTSRAGNGVALLDRISGFEALYLGFRRYRLR